MCFPIWTEYFRYKNCTKLAFSSPVPQPGSALRLHVPVSGGGGGGGGEGEEGGGWGGHPGGQPGQQDQGTAGGAGGAGQEAEEGGQGHGLEELPEVRPHSYTFNKTTGTFEPMMQKLYPLRFRIPIRCPTAGTTPSSLGSRSWQQPTLGWSLSLSWARVMRAGIQIQPT